MNRFVEDSLDFLEIIKPAKKDVNSGKKLLLDRSGKKEMGLNIILKRAEILASRN
jgi:hypothetical protein